MNGSFMLSFLPILTLLLSSLLKTYPLLLFSKIAPSDRAIVIALIWSAITLNAICPSYLTPDNSSIFAIIGVNKSVSKLESTSWNIQHHLSRPAPVSIFL